MKKLLFLLVCLGLLVSLALPVFAEAEVAVKVERSMRSAYMKCPEFQAHLAADPEGAMAALDNAIYTTLALEAVDENVLFEELIAKNKMKPGAEIDSGIGVRAIWDGSFAFVNTTLVKQNNSYYCGPASALMAITGWGGYVNGSTNSAKQVTLAGQMRTTTSGTYVWRLTNTLNNYLSSNYYSYYLGSTMTGSTFRLRVFNSLVPDRAPILHARTGALPYYGDINHGHYITITSFCYHTLQMGLHDPHINNLYYGIHSVPWVSAYNSISQYSSRYLISR